MERPYSLQNEVNRRSPMHKIFIFLVAKLMLVIVPISGASAEAVTKTFETTAGIFTVCSDLGESCSGKTKQAEGDIALFRFYEMTYPDGKIHSVLWIVSGVFEKQGRIFAYGVDASNTEGSLYEYKGGEFTYLAPTSYRLSTVGGKTNFVSLTTIYSGFNGLMLIKADGFTVYEYNGPKLWRAKRIDRTAEGRIKITHWQPPGASGDQVVTYFKVEDGKFYPE